MSHPCTVILFVLFSIFEITKNNNPKNRSKINKIVSNAIKLLHKYKYVVLSTTKRRNP